MKEGTIKFIIGFALLLSSFIFNIDENLKNIFISLAIGIWIALLIDLIVFIFQDGKYIKLYFQTKLIHRKSKVRFSMSYLYRIKVDDSYLLVKNSNWDFYQHVGGKYKRLPETQKMLNDLNASDDIKLETIGSKNGDLAVFVPAVNAIKFIKWFESKKDREISQWREFYEELLKTEVLSSENFPYVDYRYVGTVSTPLKTAPAWNCLELLQYEIYDLLPNPEQEKELRKIKGNGNSDYIIWADNELIQNLGYRGDIRKTPYKIGEHTKWAVNLIWSRT